jgi:hypothetical protein
MIQDSFVYQDEGVELMRQGKDRVEGAYGQEL